MVLLILLPLHHPPSGLLSPLSLFPTSCVFPIQQPSRKKIKNNITRSIHRLSSIFPRRCPFHPRSPFSLEWTTELRKKTLLNSSAYRYGPYALYSSPICKLFLSIFLAASVPFPFSLRTPTFPFGVISFLPEL